MKKPQDKFVRTHTVTMNYMHQLLFLLQTYACEHVEGCSPLTDKFFRRYVNHLEIPRNQKNSWPTGYCTRGGNGRKKRSSSSEDAPESRLVNPLLKLGISAKLRLYQAVSRGA